jgi:hypothetical protein
VIGENVTDSSTFRVVHVEAITPKADRVVCEVTEAARGDAWLVLPMDAAKELGQALKPLLDEEDHPAARRIAQTIISREYQNWVDLTGPRNRAWGKSKRQAYEAKVSGLKEALRDALGVHASTTDVEDFLEEVSRERSNGYTWQYDRTLGGLRKAPHSP